jgi:N-acetylmuramoyl-L-alanine amidase
MKITITAGHGANDPGAVAGKYTERDLMTELRDITADKLTKAGHAVKTDGARWENWPLVRALGLVPGADWALELHTNAAASTSATGVEVISLPRDKLRAQKVAHAMAEALGLPLRGEGGWIDQTKTARGRLAFVNAGGLIVECFFISNPHDLGRYIERKYLVASAIAEAVS